MTNLDYGLSWKDIRLRLIYALLVIPFFTAKTVVLSPKSSFRAREMAEISRGFERRFTPEMPLFDGRDDNLRHFLWSLDRLFVA